MQGLENILAEVTSETVKSNKQVQEAVRYYNTFCKENGHTPTEHAQKLIKQLPENQKKIIHPNYFLSNRNEWRGKLNTIDIPVHKTRNNRNIEEQHKLIITQEVQETFPHSQEEIKKHYYQHTHTKRLYYAKDLKAFCIKLKNSLNKEDSFEEIHWKIEELLAKEEREIQEKHINSGQTRFRLSFNIKQILKIHLKILKYISRYSKYISRYSKYITKDLNRSKAIEEIEENNQNDSLESAEEHDKLKEQKESLKMLIKQTKNFKTPSIPNIPPIVLKNSKAKQQIFLLTPRRNSKPQDLHCRI